MNRSMKRSLSMILLLALAGLGSYAPAVFAQVAPLRNTGTGLCLTVNVAGGAISQPCNGLPVQVWTQGFTGAGYLLRNNATGLCLNHNAAGAVFTSPCNPATPSQVWQRANTGPTTARFRSSANGLFVTSTAAGAVGMAPFAATPLQIWAY